MSVIPYSSSSSNLRVVLRDTNKGALVVYDSESKRLSVINDIAFNYNNNNQRQSISNALITHNNNSHEVVTVDSLYCSKCGKPFIYGEEGTSKNQDGIRFNHGGNDGFTTPTFINMNYFRLLDKELIDGHNGNSVGISHSAFSQGYFDKFFVTKGLLGRGARGAVYQVEHILDGVSLGLFALKKVSIGDDHTWLEHVLTEVNLFRGLSHPNLVSYNHVWLENSKVSTYGPKVPCAFILLEYCSGGTLEEFIFKRINKKISIEEKKNEIRRKRRQSRNNLDPLISSSSAINNNDNNNKLTIKEILSFFKDITSGVETLHQNNIIHRDLKPSNVLLINHYNGDDNNIPRVLVSDFGEGQIAGKARSATGATGTLEYCAPEVVKKIDGNLSEFTTKADIFSMGMILHFLIFGKLPYSISTSSITEESINTIGSGSGVDFLKLRQEVCEFKGFNIDSNYNNNNSVFIKRNDIPISIFKLLEKMLDPEPERRPDASDILKLLDHLLDIKDTPYVYKSRSNSIVIDDDDDGFIINDMPIRRRSSGNDSLTNITSNSMRRRRSSRTTYTTFEPKNVTNNMIKINLKNLNKRWFLFWIMKTISKIDLKVLIIVLIKLFISTIFFKNHEVNNLMILIIGMSIGLEIQSESSI